MYEYAVEVWFLWFRAYEKHLLKYSWTFLKKKNQILYVHSTESDVSSSSSQLVWGYILEAKALIKTHAVEGNGLSGT